MFYRVMLVDDEEIAYTGLRRFIKWEEFGFQIAYTANTVAKALVYLEEHAVDLVITDIRMPVQNGFQLLAVIREEYPEIFTIVLSAHGDFEYAQQVLRLGAIDFLTKPVNFQELKQLLSALYARLNARKRAIRNQQEYYWLKINNMLNNLAKGYQVDLLQDQANDYDYPMFDRLFYILRVHFNKDMAGSDLAAAKQQIRSIHLPSELGTYYSFDNERNEAAFLFFPEEAVGSVERFANLLLSRINKTQMRATIGVSAPHQGELTVKVAYFEAGKALQFSAISISQSITRFSEINNMLFLDQQIEENLTNELLQFSPSSQWNGQLNSFMLSKIDSLASSGEQGVSSIHSFCIQAMLILTEHISRIHINHSDPPGQIYSSIKGLLLTNQITDIKDYMNHWLTDLQNKLTGADHGTEPNSIIAKAKLYIAEHYAEDEVSLNFIANMFYLHPIYFSRLFREKTGINFIDFVKEVRVSRAKRLLREPAYKIYEVSQMVGYKSPRYFSKVFKNATGVTPQAFREGEGS